ncbi:glutamate formimidoyltransferase [Thermoflexibacter ruber]|uniref:glutamate formimidoyltransferase n=1 Tax=Thermoflexibacter ruber TaxID=1003 RepID=A0A1I2GVS7_9BACT|nr:glutamate formimidoyltransferase [Thermoflexibacter ruber]SFF20726.1 glutamate formiminotransferase [Thermoflexibacter ruber]
MNHQIVECVPNFSEGRDRKIISEIASAIQANNDIQLLEIDPNEDANRTVITFAGSPEAVVEAAFAGIAKASELIDMSQQKGTHPRIGATDVCPLVPLQGITMEETVRYAHSLADRVGRELNIPVYCYEYAALRPERKNLAFIRKGEYEGLAKKVQNTDFQPDFGSPVFNAKSGATVIGARDILIAYNFNLNTQSVSIAKKIAAEVRTSGNGIGRLNHLKAIGWYMEHYGIAQVSTNLTNFRQTSLHLVFQTISKVAQKYETEVIGSELVGLIPLHALTDNGKMEIDQAIDYLGLNVLRPFLPEKKIIELLLGIEVI